MTYIKHWPKFITLAALILAGFGLQACGDDDSGSTPGEDGGSVDSGAGGTGGSGGAGGSKGGTGGKKGGTGGDDTGNSSDEDAGGGTSPDSGASGDCSGADDCYSCEPKTNEQILNHCTDATCQGYDNSKLSELLPGGKLPDLP